MGSAIPPSALITISGSGSVPRGTIIAASGDAQGVVRAYVVRSTAGSTATSVDMYVVDHVDASGFSLNQVPPAEQVIVSATIATTASATAHSDRQVLSSPMAFSRGLGVILDVTATAAWEIVVRLDISATWRQAGA